MSLLLACSLILFCPSIMTTEGEITADLKTGKYQPGFEGGGELIGYNENEGKAFFYINGSVDLKVKIPDAGEYTLKVKASCQAAKKELAKITIYAGGKAIADEF